MKFLWFFNSIVVIVLGCGLVGAKIWLERGGPYLEALPRYDYCTQGASLLADRKVLEAVEIAQAGGCSTLLAQAQAQWSGIAKTVERCAQGVWRGQSKDIAGASCAIASDLFIVGDIRDLTRQSINFATHKETDYFLVALSGAGLALTLAPQMDLGVNVMKFARRAGTIGEPLAKTVSKLIRQKAWPQLRLVFTDAGHLTQKLGVTKATEALRYVDSPSELKAVASLAETKPNALLTLKWVGKDAAKLTDDTLYYAGFSRGPEGVKLAVQRGKRAFLAAHPLVTSAKSIYKGNAQVVATGAALWLLRFMPWFMVMIVGSVLIIVGVIGLLPLFIRRSKRPLKVVTFSRVVMTAATVCMVALIGFSLNPKASIALASGLPSTLSGHTKPVYAVTFSPDGSLLASVGADQYVMVWDSLTWELVKRFQAGPVRTLAFSPNGSLIATAGDDGAISLWNTESWTKSKSVQAYDRGIRALAFSPEGALLATGGRDNKPAPQGRFSKVGALFARDKTVDLVKLWDTSGWSLTRKLKDSASQIAAVSFSPTKNFLASSTVSGELQIIDTATWKDLQGFHIEDGSLDTLAFSADGTKLATGGPNHSLMVWNTETWQLLSKAENDQQPARALTYDPISGRLTTGDADGVVALHGAEGGSVISVVREDDAPVNTVSMSPDGRLIAFGSEDGTIGLTNATTVAANQ